MERKMSVEYTKAAMKELAALGSERRDEVRGWVESNLAGSDNPTSVGDCVKIRRMQGAYRWRVGSMRVLGRVDGRDVEIFRVCKRANAYVNLPR